MEDLFALVCVTLDLRNTLQKPRRKKGSGEVGIIGSRECFHLAFKHWKEEWPNKRKGTTHMN